MQNDTDERVVAITLSTAYKSVGFGCQLAWMAAALTIIGAMESLANPPFPLLIMLALTAAFSILWAGLGDHVGALHKIFACRLICSFIGPAILAAYHFVAFSGLTGILLLILTAFSLGYTFISWLRHFIIMRNHSFGKTLIASFAVAGILGVICLLPVPIPLYALVLAGCSFGALLYVDKRQDTANVVMRSARDTYGDFPISKKGLIAVVVSGLGIGLCIYAAQSMAHKSLILPLVGVGALVSCAYSAVIVHKSQARSFSLQRFGLRTFIPMTTFASMCVLVNPSVGLAVGAFVFGTCLLNEMMCVLEIIRMTKMNMFTQLGCLFTGMCVGGLIGYAPLQYSRQLWGEFGFMIVFLVVLFIVILLGNYAREDKFEDLSSQDTSFPLVSLGRYSGAVNKMWEERITYVADHYNLSARQREVFNLLARGRNAQFIQNELVIANGTAKTHINNIYQKLGVHSQQQLLDLIEGIEVK